MGRVASPIFIGRAAELAALDDALEAAAHGHTATVLIGGDAGVGKTRLLTSWNERARARGTLIVAGGCLDLGDSGPAYAAVVQALRELLRGVDPSEVEALVGPDREILARLVPELSVDGARAAGEPLSIFAQTQLFDRLVVVFDRASSDRPLVLEFEDLHWADPSTRSFLVYLVETSRAANLLVVGTYRIEETGRSHPLTSPLAQLLRRPGTVSLSLRPFDRDEAREQLTGILGQHPTITLLDAVHARAEGNPLFTEELVAAGHPSAVLPASIANALALRAATLPAASQAVLRVAAVAGRSVAYDVLRSATRLPEAELADALRAAVHANILEPEHAGERFVFRHALLEEAIYAETLPGERRRLHAAIAEALVSDDERWLADPELAPRLAHHWYEAHEPDRALRASVAAGEIAARQSAYTEALRHFQRALDLWDGAAARPELRHAWLLEQAAATAFFAGDSRRAIALGKRALGELDPSDDVLRVRLLDGVMWAFGRLGIDDDSYAYSHELARIDLTALPTLEKTLVLRARVETLLLGGDRIGAIAASDQLLDLARNLADSRLEATVRLAAAECLENLKDVEGALREARHARELAARVDDPLIEFQALGQVCEALFAAGRHEALIGAARDALEFRTRAGLVRWAWPFGEWCEAKALLALGRVSEAGAVVEAGLLDDPEGAPLLHLHTAAAESTIIGGAFDDATTHLELARHPDRPDQDPSRGYLATVRARLALAESRLDDARAIVNATAPLVVERQLSWERGETISMLVEVGFSVEADRSEAARAAGDEAAIVRSREVAATLQGHFDEARRQGEAAGVPDIGEHRGYEALIAGHLARIDGQDAPALWVAAAAAFPSGSHEGLVSRYRQAEAMLAVRVPRDEIGGIVSSALATAVEMGAHPLAERFRSLARRGRIDLRQPEPAALQDPESDVAVALDAQEPGTEALRKRGLSGREIEVLTLVAAGLSNRQIGRRLFISDKTASVHVTHILNKLGVSSRVQAATIGIRLGLPEIDADDY